MSVLLRLGCGQAFALLLSGHTLPLMEGSPLSLTILSVSSPLVFARSSDYWKSCNQKKKRFSKWHFPCDVGGIFMSKTPPPFADLVPKAGHTTEEGRLNGTSKKEPCWEFLWWFSGDESDLYP